MGGGKSQPQPVKLCDIINYRMAILADVRRLEIVQADRSV